MKFLQIFLQDNKKLQDTLSERAYYSKGRDQSRLERITTKYLSFTEFNGNVYKKQDECDQKVCARYHCKARVYII